MRPATIPRALELWPNCATVETSKPANTPAIWVSVRSSSQLGVTLSGKAPCSRYCTRRSSRFSSIRLSAPRTCPIFPRYSGPPNAPHLPFRQVRHRPLHVRRVACMSATKRRAFTGATVFDALRQVLGNRNRGKERRRREQTLQEGILCAYWAIPGPFGFGARSCGR